MHRHAFASLAAATALAGPAAAEPATLAFAGNGVQMTGSAFEFHGTAGRALHLTTVYARFTINPLCGKQTGSFQGVVVQS